MRGRRLAREPRDVGGLADVDAMHADLSASSDLGRERLQPGLVAIGEREIAAAPRQLDGQRPADAAGGSRNGGGAANRCHDVPRQGPIDGTMLYIFSEWNRTTWEFAP